MDVTELNRNQIIELKERYMIELSDEGTYSEVMGVSHDAPSWGEILNADIIISDEIIFEHYGGYTFTDDDFFCSAKLA